MNQVAAVAEPLVKYPGGKILVEPELKINMGIEWPVWFAQQPALPICIFFAELGPATIEPALPLHVRVPQHLRRNAGIYIDKTPALLVDVPFLLDVDNVADFS
jgi:hypothetical protein